MIAKKWIARVAPPSTGAFCTIAPADDPQSVICDIQIESTEVRDLIVASPDLLAVLKEIAADANRIEFHRNKRVQYLAAIAKEAVGKAKGGK